MHLQPACSRLLAETPFNTSNALHQYRTFAHTQPAPSQYPIYFSGAMATRASTYYRLLLNWAAERVKAPGARATAFGFERVLPWDPALLHAPVRCRTGLAGCLVAFPHAVTPSSLLCGLGAAYGLCVHEGVLGGGRTQQQSRPSSLLACTHNQLNIDARLEVIVAP